MSYFVFIIPLFFFVFCLMDYFLNEKKLLTPTQLVAGWWLFWLWIANFSIFGVYPPTERTQIFVLLFFVGVLVSEVIFQMFRKKSSRNMEAESLNVGRIEFWLSQIFKVTSLFTVPVVSFYFFKSFYIMYTVGVRDYRSKAFSTLQVPGLLFGSAKVESLYFFVTGPIVLFCFLYGATLFLRERTHRPLLIASILIVMDGVLRLARVNIYSFFVIFVFMYLVYFFSGKIVKSRGEKTNRKGWSYPLLASLILLFSILQIGSVRNVRGLKQFELFVVDYHTIGFALFDSELTNPTSDLNTKSTYGRLFLGGVESLFTIVIRQFDHNYMSPALGNAIRMTQDVLVGVEKDQPFNFRNGEKRYNSFYTMLYTFYSDAKEYGFLIYGFLIGLAIIYFYTSWLATNSILNFMILFLIVLTTVLSIFASQFEAMRSWMVFLMLISLRPMISVFYSKKKPLLRKVVGEEARSD